MEGMDDPRQETLDLVLGLISIDRRGLITAA